jgi:TRAP-type mannitol/chloroaromatic compound transport system permease small subunit
MPVAPPVPPNAGSNRYNLCRLHTGGVNLTRMGLLKQFDRLVVRVIGAAQWLALPLVTLLFLQWPLRDVFHAYSREANDLGQVIFALYVAVSITAATRAGTHLAADALAQGYSAKTRRRLIQIGAGVGLVPWALFVLFASGGTVLSSAQMLERFPDTSNPGYFVIKIALWVMAIMLLAQSIIDIVHPTRPGQR